MKNCAGFLFFSLFPSPITFGFEISYPTLTTDVRVKRRERLLVFVRLSALPPFFFCGKMLAMRMHAHEAVSQFLLLGWSLAP